MNTEQLVIVAILLVLLAEVTYLVAKLPRAASASKKRLIFIDTSVLIDGRILPVAASGFIGDTLAIPRSVIGELQFLADNADAEKRSRARHGLDVARELQELPGIDVQLFQDGSKAEEGVDERLLNLAKKHGGAICTIDYNLNKVAVVEGITVCNVNELAKNLRMAYLPGEKMMLELVQKGQDAHQAVGYLQDGTMVVVEHASAQLGQTVEIEFIRSLQTAAGKMMFAKRVESAAKQNIPANPSKQKSLGTKPAVRPVTKQANNNSKQQPTSNNHQDRKTPADSIPTSNTQATNTKQNNNRRPKQRRSSDRENDLISLVEKQQ